MYASSRVGLLLVLQLTEVTRSGVGWHHAAAMASAGTRDRFDVSQGARGSWGHPRRCQTTLCSVNTVAGHLAGMRHKQGYRLPAAEHEGPRCSQQPVRPDWIILRTSMCTVQGPTVASVHTTPRANDFVLLFGSRRRSSLANETDLGRCVSEGWDFH